MCESKFKDRSRWYEVDVVLEHERNVFVDKAGSMLEAVAARDNGRVSPFWSMTVGGYSEIPSGGLSDNSLEFGDGELLGVWVVGRCDSA